MLHINALTFRIGGRLLFDGATLTLPAGHRVGLVGRNGAGKSTLLKLIAGELQPDGGSISILGRGRIGMVAQEAPLTHGSLLETVLAADGERAALLAEADTASEAQRIAEIHDRLDVIDAASGPARAAAILSGLGFDEAAQARKVADFSGGWRMRVALAAALFSRPDLLLLDEPTNHLDLEATLWLETFLAGYPGTLLVVSHDRTLLNAAVKGIIHLEGGKLSSYAGGYDDFERLRREKLELAAKAHGKQLAQRRKIQAFVDRFRAKATKARQAQSRLKMLERMPPLAAIVEERSIAFDFPDPEPLSPPLIALEKAEAGYDAEKPILRALDLTIDTDDRIALLGANGNGKSTLVKLLAGRLQPLGGTLRKSGKLRIGYFAQHQAEELELEATPYDHMAKVLAQAPPSRVRAHLGRFGFGQERAEVKAGALSGGEKARLLFALMSREAPHLMLLDEPTNHLDIDAREALVAALNAYEGAVILISHDPHLIELCADRLWLVEGGTCTPFDGDLADYRRRLLDQRREARRESRKGDGVAGRKEGSRKDERRAAAKSRADLVPLRKAAQAAEKKILRLDEEKQRLEARLADPALYGGPAVEITRLQQELAEIARQIAAAETIWLEAQEALEA